MTIKKRSARIAVASVALATGAALVGVSAAVAQSGDTPDAPDKGNHGKADVDHGQHKGWAKVHENANNGKHKGWDQHGQHGGAPEATPEAEKLTKAEKEAAKEAKKAAKAAEKALKKAEQAATPHGKAGQDHGKAGDDHGKAGQKGKGAENGEAGQDHGKAGDDHGKAGQEKPEKKG